MPSLTANAGRRQLLDVRNVARGERPRERSRPRRSGLSRRGSVGRRRLPGPAASAPLTCGAHVMSGGFVVLRGVAARRLADRDVAERRASSSGPATGNGAAGDQRGLVRVGDDDRPVQPLEHLVRRGVVMRVIPEDPGPRDLELVEERVARRHLVLASAAFRRSRWPARCRASGCPCRARGCSRSGRSPCRPTFEPELRTGNRAVEGLHVRHHAVADVDRRRLGR